MERPPKKECFTAVFPFESSYLQALGWICADADVKKSAESRKYQNQ